MHKDVDDIILPALPNPTQKPTNPPFPVKSNFLTIVVFSAGMTTLALELSAARLLGSVFGTSNLVWASIIGLILIYLAVGYFIGGRWADRSPYAVTLYGILAWGAFTAGLVPLAARPLLRLAADAFDLLNLGVLVGSFVVVLVLFTLPVTLLAMVSPFAIRLSVLDPLEAGRISGKIYGVSTLGSFVGTFLPVLVFIPLVGTTWTFLIFSLFLLFIALTGLVLAEGWHKALRFAWMPVLLIILGLAFASRPIKSTAGQIFESESAYNYIQVLESEGYRFLRLNEGQGVHSTYHPTVLNYYGPWEQFLAAPFLNPAPYGPEDVKSIAIVGLAAGTLARQATEVFGPIPIDGFEIDPGIIKAGREYFGMTMPNLNAVAEDGRWGLDHSDKKYSLIALDAYRPPYIPWHLTTQEFFKTVKEHLAEDGVMAINVGRAPEDRQLIDGLVGTVQSVFPSVYVMDLPDTFNSLIYATAQPTEIEDLYQNYLALQARPDIHPLLNEAVQRLIVYQKPTPANGLIFTDDWAPIEWITNNMVLKFVLFGGMEDLQ